MALKKIEILTEADLHPDDFIIVDKKVRLKSNVSGSYALTYATGRDTLTTWNEVDYDNINRHYMDTLNGLGFVHLDFKVTKNTGIINLFNLPQQAPVFTKLREVQVGENASVWIDAGNRVIRASGLKANTRYIVDLTGILR